MPSCEDVVAFVLFPTNRRGVFVVSPVVEVTEDAPSVPERMGNGRFVGGANCPLSHLR